MRISRMQLGPLIGVAVAAVAVLGGQWLEGGRLSSVLQPTAALIVLGGTAGAVLLQFPLAQVRAALQALRRLLATPPPVDALVARLILLARRARREGLLALERELDTIDDPFLRRALALAIDGVAPDRLRETMELELDAREAAALAPARVLEAAGGYAPTVGILGAVLGLVHVMEHLSEPARLGAGIAVAFVATLYGVGLANLVLLPLAGKLRNDAAETVQRLEIALEGAVAISRGEGARAVEERLAPFVSARPARRLSLTRHDAERAA